MPTPIAPWGATGGMCGEPRPCGADDKRRARINMIHHLLSTVPYEPVTRPPLTLPTRPDGHGYRRPPRDLTRYVPDFAGELLASESGS